MRVLHIFTVFTTPKAFFDGQFRFLSERGFEQHLITSDAEDRDFCARNNITYHRAPLARRIDLRADLKAILDVRRYIKTNDIDTVVGHTQKGAMVAMIAAWMARVPRRVYYRHGLVYTTASGLKRVVLKSVERLTALLATDIVNVSPSLSALAVKDSLNSARKQRIFGAGTCGGIDARAVFNPANVALEETAALRQKYRIGESDFVAGFCGRLCRDKGIIERVEAFRLFRDAHPGIKTKLLLAGPYDKRDILPTETKEAIETDPDIIYTGQLPQSALPAHYMLMDVFVFPSHREGFGMTVIEASAMERPVLVSKAHGCVDTIVPDTTGRYIGNKPEEISAGLSDMLDSPLRTRLGAEGRKHVLKNFDHTVLRPIIANFYKNLSRTNI